LQVIAGADPADDTASDRPTPDYRRDLEQPIRGLRLGIPQGPWFFGSLDPVVEAAVAHEGTYPARKDEYGPVLASEIGRAHV